MTEIQYDLCIIGGGINGAGIARDAAGRGLSVVLLEARDLASGTSSASTKLVHGGLRYLEYCAFKLVRDSLRERENLLRIAPHIIWPMTFVLPHDQAQRPFWMIRSGLFLYDNMARRERLEASKPLDFKNSNYAGPLKTDFKKGFSYMDCWAEDSRLVVLNAVDAKERGAVIKTRCVCTNLTQEADHWRVSFSQTDPLSGHSHAAFLSARCVVNAAGPWAYRMLEKAGLAAPDVPKLRLVKGSHIIVKRTYVGDHAYVVQQPDRRIVFVIPYERDYTLIGTTEQNFDAEADIYDAQISAGEIAYLVDAYNRSFQTPLSKSDVLWAYSGIRPLLEDGDASSTSASRDFRLNVHETDIPMITVFGGKLTTYRVVSEAVVDQVLATRGSAAPSWTAQKPLPGGGFTGGDFEAFLAALQTKYPWLDPVLVRRLARAYGTRAERFLEGAGGPQDLGRYFGSGVYEAEIVYLIEHEFAQTLEDVLWRRSKLGLHIDDATREALENAFPGLWERAGK